MWHMWKLKKKKKKADFIETECLMVVSGGWEKWRNMSQTV